MTRLADSLRGLADRAPIEESSVSVVDAARRVRRGRRLRAAANATAGVGVAGVIALAAINPGATPVAKQDASDERLSSPAFGEDASAAGGVSADGAFGVCGWWMYTEQPDAMTISEPSGEVNGGDHLDIATTVTFSDTGEFTTSGPQVLALWNDIVVGVGSVDAGDPILSSLTDGQIVTSSAGIDLVNCWDGSPLPGGDYELMASQEFTEVATDPIVTPPPLPTEPSTTPTEPTVAPAEPSAAPGTDVEYTVTVVAPSGDDTPVETTEPATGVSPDGSLIVRFASATVPLTIAGDVPEDPFGEYLNPGPTYPEDYLYPDTARELYAANATNTPWDMAAGTQRVVKVSDSVTSGYASQPYFGCAYDDSQPATFPKQSAALRLLDVEVTLPSRIDVSYGWIVEDNPRVDLKVTNASDYSLPGFWGQANSSLVLVKDGKVVAEGYPVTLDPNANLTTDPDEDGMLSPEEAVTGQYIWRDVNGCWTDAGSTPVQPGTYTVLNLQSLYIDNGGVMTIQPYVGDATARDTLTVDPATGAATSKDVNAVDGADASSFAPAPDQGDWVEFQVWTSLGKITVS